MENYNPLKESYKNLISFSSGDYSNGGYEMTGKSQMSNYLDMGSNY